MTCSERDKRPTIRHLFSSSLWAATIMLAGGIATPAHAVIVDVIENRGLFFVTEDYCEVEFRVGVRRDPAAEPDSLEPTRENLVIVLKDSSGAEFWSRNHFADSTEFTSGHFAYGEMYDDRTAPLTIEVYNAGSGFDRQDLITSQTYSGAELGLTGDQRCVQFAGVSNEETGDTASVSQAFEASRSNALIANQPRLHFYLSRSLAGGVTMNANEAGGTMRMRTGSDRPVWADLTAEWASDDNLDDSYVFGSVGAHAQLNTDLLIGGMLQFDRMSRNSGGDGTGWLVGPYMVSRLRDQLYFESRLLFGQSQNSIDGAEYDSDRALFQATLAGRTELGNSVIWPTLSYTIAQDDADAYIDAGSNPVAAATTTVRRAELGISFERPLALSGLDATLEGDAFLVGVDDSTQANTDARARIGLGVRMLTSGGLDTSVRVGYEGASSESSYESFSVGFQTELKF